MAENSNQNAPRPLHIIAREIYTLWRDKDGNTELNPRKKGYAAEPYVGAMRHLVSVTDNYGYDSGKEIVIKFLGNSRSWTGEDAKRIKNELRRMVGMKEAK